HVRAIGQVVRAKLAHPELIEKRRLVTQAAGSIKGRLMRTLQRTKRFANQRESVFPGDRLVLVGPGVVEQRLGEPTCCFEIVVAPRRQLAHGMGGEKIAIGFGMLKLPGDVLDAVFADVESQTGRVIRPRAAGTIETTVLMVHHEDRAKALDRLARPCENVSDAFGRAPPSGGMMVWMPRVAAVNGRSATEGGLAGNRAEHQLLCVGCWVQWIAHNSPLLLDRSASQKRMLIDVPSMLTAFCFVFNHFLRSRSPEQ